MLFNKLNNIRKSKVFRIFFFSKIAIKLVFLLIVLNSCMTYEDVQFKGVNDFKIEKANKEEVRLKFDARVYNPNGYNIKIKAKNLDVSLSGNSLAKADLGKKVIIRKNTTGDYEIVVVVKLKDLMKSVGGSLLNVVMNKSVKLEISGDAKVSAKGLSKKFPISFDYPLDVRDLNIGGLDFLK